jgi:hypothetical protein
VTDPRADRERDDALEWLAAQARELEQRVADLISAASHLGEERVAAARAAAEAIVNAALREAEEIRRAARSDAAAAAGSDAPKETHVPPQATPPTRARVFVGGDDVEGARRLAEELILGGLGRARIEAELAARFPTLGAERIDAIIRALLVPPSATRREAAGD